MTSSDDELYLYDPSVPLAWATVGVFGALCIGHTAIASLAKMVRPLWPFIVGVAMEAVGYGLRTQTPRFAGPDGDKTVDLLIGSSLCIILAPAFMAATLYMFFGRLMRLFDDSIAPIRSTWVTKIFVGSDVISLIVQSIGGGMVLQNDASRQVLDIGNDILIVGFIVQIAAFCIFLGLAYVFHMRVRRTAHQDAIWRCERVLWTIYTCGILISIRSVFRTVEYATGSDGDMTLQAHEAYFYCLETLPIVACVVIFLVLHPRRWIPSDPNARLVKEGAEGIEMGASALR